MIQTTKKVNARSKSLLAELQECERVEYKGNERDAKR